MQTIEQMTAQIREEMAASDRVTLHKGYSITQLREAFSIVENPANWKYEISAVVALDAAPLYVTAIEFMVGGPTLITRDDKNNEARIYNAGYYANIGA